MKNLMIVSALSLCLSSCFDRSDKKVNTYYSLTSVDGRVNMNLVHDYGEYALGIVPATIFSVKVYPKYLVVKQHPQNGVGGMAKEYTNYYIVKSDEPDFFLAKESRIGPLQEKEFNAKAIEMGFDKDKIIKEIVFDDLM